MRMVTGDNVETARAIAEKCGIITKGDRTALVMEGRVFKKKVINDQGIVSNNGQADTSSLIPFFLPPLSHSPSGSSRSA